MTGRNLVPNGSDRGVLAGVAICALLLLGTGLASADSSHPPPLAHAVSTQARPQTAEPGVFQRIARWFDDAFSGIGKVGDQTRGAFKDMADGVSESAGSVASLSKIRIVSKRQRCEPAANGAPDCRRAAELACRSEGYASGRSFETQSERVCSAPRLFAEAPQPTCRTETVVLRSICQ